MSYTLLTISIFLLHTAMAAWSVMHALLNKRDPRAALGWIAVSIFFTIIGPLMYWVFGINRVQMRAQRLLDKSLGKSITDKREGTLPQYTEITSEERQAIRPFIRVSDKVCRLPAMEGNQVDILFNGDQTYPAMLKAIEEAEYSVFLMTYIFDTDDTGKTFMDALVRSNEKGLDVKVLVDGVGEMGNWRRASTLLAKRGVNVERFLPLSAKPPAFYWNLRNHRKLLVVDNRVAFTGGINISSRHVLENNHADTRVVDLHFRLMGPIVAELQTVFMDDWEFVTSQRLTSPPVEPQPKGRALCRVIMDEPSENLDRLATTLVGAVSAAQQQVVVVTPYFLPSRELMAALQAAALRDVKVIILLPEKNDSRVVHWATRNLLRYLIRFDVEVYYQPPPFVHSKLFIVDEELVFFGSANIDPRSLRLNFELNVEAYDKYLVNRLLDHVNQQIKASKPFTTEDLEQRSMPSKIRDAAAWLFSPYL